ncbi:protein xpaC [Pontibacillus halophilus JSM 076056 = DSM 19796]|uniref:Protein xpaC n=1 Tax=Pontibacillus halophilus JSM 076056 = DSM 19796 TaxID=1385510 RepID=A0A0A5GL65_9BACI|nr:5-bromo-4-chloroindolyl phosphate hydrolysis family protein [Pontibacillus halophilus]KGX92744.1 protein xpaC [Pontibacillus halophilus JSM 076056 = DSM 19796]
MKAAFHFLLRAFISAALFTATFPLLYFNTDYSFFSSLFIAIGLAVVTYLGIRAYTHFKFLRDNGLTRKDYRYIQENLKEAERKRQRLNQALFRVRSFQALKEIGVLQRNVTKMFRVVRREPRRFYEADHFFYYQLDSIVELSDKYTRLASQSLKDEKTDAALQETEEMLRQLAKSVEEELASLFRGDVEEMTTELEVAEHSLRLQKGIKESNHDRPS